MKSWQLALLGITLAISLQARESYDEVLYSESAQSDTEGPWFTGPLLTPSGHVVPVGHQNYEPYFYWTQATGTYDSHWKPHSSKTFNDLLTQITIQLGVIPGVEFDLAPQFAYNKFRGEHMWRVSDLPLTLAFQILKDKPGKWYPAIKLRFAANIPLGKYDHLDPSKFETDAGGVGNWLPQIGLVFTRLHHITGQQYLSWRAFFNYTIPTHVGVSGLSIHGGAPTIPGIPGTRATVKPGNIFTFLYGAEYSLTKNWVLALDILYQHNNKRTFSGYTPPGTTLAGPSREMFALAPGIEYNWNSNIGIIVGPWFAVAGRNTERFISYIFAINIYN